ncbi:DNA-cytosine methyltransferase [Methanosarcina siciliae T4/M]|uniref:DNA (cytosine-5-)-methyltransferase n=1 Tax=Methanosarcina siciliae T4/M TaxID=1434120 RepID=A0A0E3L861_9EURY|nr:DNA cytosine methyltransferase [Methanosarcina siciliae]AKB27961.1 DNA-cytosine methyltransferase [Methanosarcina siciliae T4/M]
MKSKYTVLDMFSGAGGLSEGFFQNGFKFVSHIEKNDHARNSLETRAIYHALKDSSNEGIYRDYISGNLNRDEFIQKFNELEMPPAGLLQGEITESNETDTIKEIQDHLKIIDRDSVDVVIGGPPCQAYSVAGRGRKPKEMKNDPRNYLYRHYVSFLKSFEPKIFVFENVPGIKSAINGIIYSNLHEELEKIGYKTVAHILNAKDFSVLQERKRIIFIGWKDEYDLSYPDFLKIPPSRFHVSSLLKDLPPLQAGEGTDSPAKYTRPFSRTSEYLQRFMIREKKDILIQHNARIHNPRDRIIYRLAIEKWDKERKRLKYNELSPELQTHRNKTSFLDRFKVVNQYGYSHAVLAHISKDGHYFIHPDIKQARSMTVREVARIQSFPDNYKFEGPRIAQYAQIGNAVPPLMAKGIAVEIEKMLKEIS